MPLGEIDPVLLPQGLLLQFMGWGQPQMAARQIQCVVARKATSSGMSIESAPRRAAPGGGRC